MIPKKRYLFLLALLAAIFFRGPLFRAAVSYEPVKTRAFQPLTAAPDLFADISEWAAANPEPTTEQLIAFARRETARRVGFVMRQTSGRPDDVVAGGEANCVGYARLFAAILDRAARATGRGEEIEQTLLVGELSLFGESLHQLTSDPFWRDHDYNKVVDRVSGEVWFLDVTLYDYTWVRWVR